MQIPGFTPQETKVLIFLVAALIAGSGITWYKRTHPQFAPELMLQEAEANSLPQNGGVPERGSDARTLDINQATAEELQLLPGIGPGLSQRIVECRKINGRFGKIEDIMQVKGIGPKTFEQIKDCITVQVDTGKGHK